MKVPVVTDDLKLGFISGLRTALFPPAKGLLAKWGLLIRAL